MRELTGTSRTGVTRRRSLLEGTDKIRVEIHAKSRAS